VLTYTRDTLVNLNVDLITDISWNKQAFEDLVVDSDIKEMVQAVVMKQLAAQKSTDVISNKGNGLIILLHGAPGTGKTFTAEGVAEFAEKPLFRVTCGDIGTEARAIETQLQASLNLGKIWDCGNVRTIMADIQNAYLRYSCFIG
jgi:SpoVK/Ycf46/Vps4 family AAA+-type ATPase